MSISLNYDVVIIGGGVIGCAVARELARTDLRTALLEKENDVCEGTSKANSGIVHAGFDAAPGTLKARLNVQGSLLMKELSEKLDFDYINNGSLVLCMDENKRSDLEVLYQRGLANGVQNLSILEKDELKEMEPYLSDEVVCALYAPTAGIVCPFGLTIALAENAADNGVRFYFNTPVSSVKPVEDGWLINETIKAKVVVNAAGVHGDEIHNMVSSSHCLLKPRRGEYLLMEKSAGSLCTRTLFQLPDEKGKGVLVTPTVHGNLLTGPTADFIVDKDDSSTTFEGLEKVRKTACKSIPDIPFNKTITSFSGIRAVPDGKDFIIEESEPGFIDAIGIESPGLSAAPAIGIMITNMVSDRLHPGINQNFKETRKGFVNLSRLSFEEWNQLIRRDPEYGKVICRCETITAGQIWDALTRSIPARSLDGIKRRVRAGMGKCQSGFCSPKVMEIMSEEMNESFDRIYKSTPGSNIVSQRNRKQAGYEQ